MPASPSVPFEAGRAGMCLRSMAQRRKVAKPSSHSSGKENYTDYDVQAPPPAEVTGLQCLAY